MQTPTAIIFDCFGVLYQDAFRQFLDEYAATLPNPREYYYGLARQNEYGALSDADFYTAFADDSGLSSAELKHRFNDTGCLNAQVAGIARQLHDAGYKTGMLSNTGRDFLERFLASNNIGPIFDAVVASSEVGHEKPEREIFEAMRERIAVPFEQWLFIDDGPANVEAAKSYGIPSHLFTTSRQLRAALAEARVYDYPQRPKM